MATDAKLMLNTLWGEFGQPMNMTGTWQRRDTMRWQKTEAPLHVATAAVDTQERLDPTCQVWSLALGYHSNRCIGLGRIVPGCLGRAYRDVHHAIG